MYACFDFTGFLLTYQEAFVLCKVDQTDMTTVYSFRKPEIINKMTALSSPLTSGADVDREVKLDLGRDLINAVAFVQLSAQSFCKHWRFRIIRGCQGEVSPFIPPFLGTFQHF